MPTPRRKETIPGTRAGADPGLSTRWDARKLSYHRPPDKIHFAVFDWRTPEGRVPCPRAVKGTPGRKADRDEGVTATADPDEVTCAWCRETMPKDLIEGRGLARPKVDDGRGAAWTTFYGKDS